MPLHDLIRRSILTLTCPYPRSVQLLAMLLCRQSSLLVSRFYPVVLSLPPIYPPSPHCSCGECVPFHHDSAAVVVNIALNDGFCGGNLVCVVANQVVLPDRPAGCATAHNSAIVHGVTEIRAGVRYNLFCEFK